MCFIATDCEENKVSFQKLDLRHSNLFVMRLSGTRLDAMIPIYDMEMLLVFCISLSPTPRV